MLTEWSLFAENIGFPALLIIYLLSRFERKLDRLTKEIRRNSLKK
ncbi:YvrJ family protein [Alkalicoccus daliensis]|uniref:YvrJ protein family protein n=1 Tax=Alkalicoccus daliensis TaxID=745820 RepID=A0A1H0GX70_9BACI|nr:YvrJ family protein [Alkalicoccus daliensis]SDO11458.1 YvrJ protein family protein [Alkalicoccus daliensis]